ncbi:MAG: class I SAM-dependent methyltransferase [Rhabdochlamydiaceae bacterium]|jgi:hypothetical protein
MNKMLTITFLVSSVLFGSPQENSLLTYLDFQNVRITEGYMVTEQQRQFCERLKSYGNIKTILEIGLNAGHSAENFFQACPNLELFVSFDINSHDYTKHAVDYLSNKYSERFLFVAGDSAVTVPKFCIDYPHQLFDLIYVDGNHTFEYAFGDIFNCGSLAHLKTILWVDDYSAQEVYTAMKALEIRGVIKILNVYHSSERCWAEAQYTAPFLFSRQNSLPARYNPWRMLKR